MVLIAPLEAKRRDRAGQRDLRADTVDGELLPHYSEAFGRVRVTSTEPGGRSDRMVTSWNRMRSAGQPHSGTAASKHAWRRRCDLDAVVLGHIHSRGQEEAVAEGTDTVTGSIVHAAGA